MTEGDGNDGEAFRAPKLGFRHGLECGNDDFGGLSLAGMGFDTACFAGMTDAGYRCLSHNTDADVNPARYSPSV